jgi:hypothetical protein
MPRKPRIVPAYRERRRQAQGSGASVINRGQGAAELGFALEQPLEQPPLAMPRWLARFIWAAFGGASRAIGWLQGTWHHDFERAYFDQIFRVEVYASEARFHRARGLWFVRLARLARGATPPSTSKPRPEHGPQS